MDIGLGQSLFNLIGIGVFFYGILLAALLLFSKGTHKSANRMLALIILIGVWYVIAAILVLTGKFVYIASFFRVGLPSFYAVPPLILWYVKSRIDQNFRVKPIDFLHFIPVVFTIFDSIPFHLLSAQEKVNVLQMMSSDLRNIMEIRTGLIPDYLHFFIRPIHGLVYTSVAGWYLYDSLKDKKLRKEIESQSRLKTWFILFISFFSLIYLALFLTNLVWVALPYGHEELSLISLIPSTLSVIIFLAVHIFLVFNTHIIFGKQTPKPKANGATIAFDKNAETINSIDLQEIDKLVVEKQIFKNPKITAPEVANMAGISPHTFSNALNNNLGKSFPDFINTYRIQYVIAELKKGMNSSMSIEGIATEAGFASRSAFYNSFKKITGLTPSEYLKSQEKA